ncbi:MAG: D-alanyl-D-alanine carboxypeptidase [Firmicutes bacterium]|nr:D-alanyl-D-alanine carboxypeptidase [Bacillota bacterium]MCL1953376.1 D-alanyl-D-alanine carboxypeptidase [Bacillota bacterium]
MNKKACSLYIKYILFSIFLFASCVAIWGYFPQAIDAHASSASSMIVLEASTNRILKQQNAYSKRYMASTTKIVTAITVIKHANLDDIVTVPKEAVGVEGSSIYLELGEQIKVLDLLYGLMLQSGNDTAVALAIYVGGSVPNFAKLMNDTAKEAGALNSNFVNPHGLHDDNHYTTAYDLGLVSTYAMKDETFKKISATKSHTVDRPKKGWKHAIKNKNKILHTFDGGDGVKTGFTKKAGRCLVSSATRDGMQVVCVVLNCGPMFEECRALMQQAFDNYSLVNILESYCYAGQANIENGRQEQVGAYSQKSFYYPLRKDEIPEIKKLVEFDKIKAPIKKDQKVGRIIITLHDRPLFEQELYSIDEVKGITIMDKLKDLLPDWLG